MGGHLTCAAITDQEHHLYTVHTTVDGERLIAQFRSAQAAAQAVVRGPDDQQICFLISGPTDCVAPVAGAYTIDVYLYSGTGTDSYAIGVDSRDNPAHCTQIDPDFFAVTAKPLGGSLPAGSAGDCYRFAGRPGEVLRIRLSAAADVDGGTADVRGVVESAGRETSCDLYYSRECTLAGDGPYTFFLTEQYAGAASYRLRMTRLDQPTGCAPLTEGTFGALTAAQVDQGKLDHDGFRCLEVAASAGRHLVRFEHDGSASWTLRDAAGNALCSDYDPAAWAGCVVPAAGDYLLWVENGNDLDGPIPYQIAAINLAGTTGCANAVGTAWDQPALRFPHASPLQVFCQPFTAQPGERVVGYGPGNTWISDVSGDRICDGLAGSDDEDGCVLPGSGPYRLLSSPDSGSDGGTVELQVGRLSSPAGCPTAAPGAYGGAPSSPLGANRCRLVTIPAAGAYQVRAVDHEGYPQWSRIYDRDGKRLCTTEGTCTFPAAGSYALVANGGNHGVWDTQFAVSVLATTAPGCVTVTDQGAGAVPVHGRFATAGQIDCLRLPTAAGSLIGVLVPPRSSGAARPDRTLVDATGQPICDEYTLDDGSCRLTGQAPFRVLLGASEGTPTGDYLIAVQRSGPATGCAALPQGAIGGLTGTTVAFSPTRFTACFAIPAGQHSTAELVSYQALTGTGWARLYVFDAAGNVPCTTGQFIGPGRFVSCHLTAGAGYTAVVVADPVTSKYRVSRKDASPAGAKCQAPASTTLGGKASAGTLVARDDLRCYRITGTAATMFWVSARSNGALAHYLITDASGANEACGNTAAPCRLTGSAKYQVFVWGETDKHPVPYQLDTWNIGTPGQTPAQCKPVPSAAGFGPLAATLAGDRTGACLAVPVRNLDRFTVAVTNAAGGSTEPWQPMPYLFVPEGATGPLSGCALAEGGYLCEPVMPMAQRSGVALFVVSPGQTLGKTFPFRARATCDGLCDAAPYSLTSVAPDSVPNGGKVTVTLHGTSLFPVDSVVLSRAGAAPIRAVARTVSVDRQVMTVQVDLTTAPAGAWTVSATAYSGGSRAGVLAGALTVTASALRATKAPSISGSARPGRTVRVVSGSWTPSATGYAYQWLANGAAIKGAVGPAYVVPAALLGRKLSVTVTAKRSGFGDGRATSAAVTVVR